MKEFKRTTLSLTLQYSLLFFLFTWILSGGIYAWVNNSLGEGYVQKLNTAIEQNGEPKEQELTKESATFLADVTLDRLRNILLIFNGVALFIIPSLAYILSRRSVAPLIASQSLERQFVANASHELRTPLAVMLGELEWALKHERSASDYRQTIGNARDEVTEMSRAITGLLNISKLHDRKLENLVAVDLNDIVTTTTNRWSVAAESKGINFALDIKPVQVKGRPELLSVVLNNLLDNAVKYSVENSSVAVSLHKIGNKAQLTVLNTMENKHDQVSNRIFEPYYQQRKDSQSGYGLGLSIVKQIIDAHEGTVEAAVDGGSMKIIIRLEIYED